MLEKPAIDAACGAFSDIEQATIEGAVLRLRPKLTVAAVLASLALILWATGVGSDVMKPIAAPIVGGMITSTINVLDEGPRAAAGQAPDSKRSRCVRTFPRKAPSVGLS
jgi:Cu/Ag efflux pump CusA